MKPGAKLGGARTREHAGDAPGFLAPERAIWHDLGIFLLSAGTLLFEITLTRLFSVAQFYHFAFMIVSLAMLGFGASGTWLALVEGRGKRLRARLPALFAAGFGFACLGAYGVFNWLPFDSFSIAWDIRQVLLLCLHYVVLTVPFFCSGAVLSLRFGQVGFAQRERLGLIYAYNLAGSACGCALALVLPRVVGGTGPVWVSGILGGLAALALLLPMRQANRGLYLAAMALVVIGSGLIVLSPDALSINISPYKGLSYALQPPGARTVWQAWNGYSRVDLVESPTVRSLPGLSYRFGETPPPQFGLFVDGDDLSPVLRVSSDGAASAQDGARTEDYLAFAPYMPTAIAYRLRPGGNVLILEPRGGLEVWVALGAISTDQVADDRAAGQRIVAVTSNPLVAQVTSGQALRSPEGGDRVAPATGIVAVVDDPRSYASRRSSEGAGGSGYDVVTLAFTRPYRPIRSGAYSLGEDYAYTVEAFQDYLGCLAPEGFLVVSSWLQTPPSESLRTFALIVEALEASGGNPRRQVIAFRGYATMTFLVSRSPLRQVDLDAVESFAASRAFDMVYAPGLQPDGANRYNILPSAIYYETFNALVNVPSAERRSSRDAWYAEYPFDVRPPTDDHPFFGHFFRWSQAGQILSELGKTWQPFGGAGYFVLVALLALSLVAGLVLIGLPVLVAGHRSSSEPKRRPPYEPGPAPGSEPDGVGRGSQSTGNLLAYFGLLGLGYLFVENPLMQQTILFLGYPARAVTVVLFTVLLFSGIGSAFSSRLKLLPVWVLSILVVVTAATAVGLPRLYEVALPWSWWARAAVVVVGLAPLGLLMGLPFPLGLRYVGAVMPHAIPWAWAANGALSVVASVLSAIVALSAGFRWVLVAGAAAYGVAALLTLSWRWDSATA